MVYIPGLGNTNTLSSSGGGSAGANGLDALHCGLRLTSVTATPILTSTQLAKTTLFDTPFKSNYISLYTGSVWAANAVPEASLSTSGFTASRVHDIYGYMDGSTYTLEAVAWANNTTKPTRGTQNGITVKDGDPTKRFRGSVYVNASKEIEWSIGGSASGGTEIKHMIWNQDNRLFFSGISREAATSWTHAANSTWSSLNSSTANRYSFVIGEKIEPISADLIVRATTASGGVGSVAFGLDVTNTPTANQLFGPTSGTTNNPYSPLPAKFKSQVDEGLHFLQAIEYSTATITTFYGYSSTYTQSGIIAGGYF